MIAFGESLLESRSDRALRILLIDDDELSRELLTLLLEVDGYGVVSAASGDEGLARLGGLVPQPDAVLTDLQMPGISGTSLAQALRAALPSGVPVIAMSGSDSRPPGTPAGAPAGFDGFLLKPFAVADLRAALAEAHGSRTERSEAALQNRVQSAEDTSSPALNEEVFVKMQELMPPAQLGQMYALCLADARTRLDAMRAAVVADDDAGFRREAHAIKGGAGMIGAEEIYKLATQAERDGLAQADVSAGINRVTAFFDQLSSACERLERMLVERLHP